MKELIDAVADMDWGSKAASILAGRFSNAAQKIRDYAEQLAAEADSHGSSLQGVALSLLETRTDSWSGMAEASYTRLLQGHSDSSARISGELSESALLLRQAGQEMASQLEGFATNLVDLGSLFDSALDVFAESYEKVEEAIDDIYDSPVAGIQHQINDFKNNPLLRFAEELS